ncbi:MAG: hypothetical protein D6799_01495, partial [Bacteroidetes bacterium]
MKFLKILTLTFLFSSILYAQENSEQNTHNENPHTFTQHQSKANEENVDIAKVAFEHILDSHYWH